MRVLCHLLLAMFAAVAAWDVAPSRADESHDELRVLEPADRPLLHEYLLREVSRQYDERRKALIEALPSPAAINARREQLRGQLALMLGDLPERTPLNGRTLGTIQCDGYRIERVIYESRPRHHVTANLYLPDPLPAIESKVDNGLAATNGSPGKLGQSACGGEPICLLGTNRIPGVLVPCGHSSNGKASEAYQSVCVLLALNGCAALIYDPIGQGERNQIVDLSPHGTTEHTLVGPGALLVGRNTANYRIWDGLCSMDYLASRSEVDPTRLGCTGNSGGGTMTTWLMAVDDRIVAAAPSCFITTVEQLFNTIGPQDCEQHFPGQGAFGIEHADFIAMRAPQPTLILAAERDFFDIGGTRTAYADAEAVFRTLGHPERVALFTCDDEHGFSQPRRQAAVAWMRRWLASDERAVVEPKHELQRDADLQVTASGQVLSEFADEVSVVDLSIRRAEELADLRAAAWQASDEAARRATIERLLGVREKCSQPAKVNSHGTVARDGYFIEKLLIEPADGVPLAALCFVPDDANTNGAKLPAILYPDGRGKATDAEPGGPIEQLVKQGHVVLTVDLRGWGETADGPKQSKYRNDEFRNAMLAMHVGRPLLGQRVEDLVAALNVLAADARVDANAIQLIGVDRAGPVALHAAVLDPRFRSVAVRDSIRSWADDVVARPLVANQLSQVVPGALEHYDLPDLVEMLGKRAAKLPAEVGPGR
ncbi:MAG: prolyl oligopeptidase family serine peptidase [Pirellulales bacterium]